MRLGSLELTATLETVDQLEPPLIERSMSVVAEPIAGSQETSTWPGVEGSRTADRLVGAASFTATDTDALLLKPEGVWVTVSVPLSVPVLVGIARLLCTSKALPSATMVADSLVSSLQSMVAV